MTAEITGIEYFLPKKKIDLKKLCKKNNWPYKKVIKATGIKYTHQSSKNETALDLPYLLVKNSSSTIKVLMH